MKRIQWAVSPIYVTTNENKYDMRGMLLASYENGEQYTIPFGAQGEQYQIAYEKCVSEMCERATWFVLYSENNRLFYSTEGFAAHTDRIMASKNAKSEFRERNIKNLIFSLLFSDCKVITDYCSISKNKDQLLFSYIDEASCYYSLLLQKRTINNYTGLVLGMGKSSQQEVSFLHSIEESELVEKALSKYLSNNLTIENILLKKELEEYYNYFCSRKLLSYFDTLQEGEYPKEKDSVGNKHVLEQCYSCEVTDFLPNFLIQYKRSVFYAYPTSQKNTISNIIHMKENI